MEMVLAVVKKVVVFCLVSFVILELSPKEEYKKYFNLFTGMVLILLLISPLYELFTGKLPINDELEKYYLRNELKDMDMYFNEYDKMRVDAITGGYKEQIEQHIADIAKQNDLAVEEVFVSLNTDVESEDFLQVTDVSLKVSKKYRDESLKIREIVTEKQDGAESLGEIAIKKTISQFYNVETDNINIIK
ncbi:MAG: stage III sporulation protein AF [Alistipes sp.]|nr:stage III sporulation protein AF [Alistipes sp.]